MDTKELTVCERLGYKEGDLFIVTNPDESTGLPVGTRVRLIEDDGSNIPLFEILGARDGDKIRTSYLIVAQDTPMDVVDVEPWKPQAPHLFNPSTGEIRELDVRVCPADDKPGGSTPSQYGLPPGATDLQDLIEYRDMDFSLGNIFKAAYRMGHCDHSDALRELRKIVWFAQRKIALLEKQQ